MKKSELLSCIAGTVAFSNEDFNCTQITVDCNGMSGKDSKGRKADFDAPCINPLAKTENKKSPLLDRTVKITAMPVNDEVQQALKLKLGNKLALKNDSILTINLDFRLKQVNDRNGTKVATLTASPSYKAKVKTSYRYNNKVYSLEGYVTRQNPNFEPENRYSNARVLAIKMLDFEQVSNEETAKATLHIQSAKETKEIAKTMQTELAKIVS